MQEKRAPQAKKVSRRLLCGGWATAAPLGAIDQMADEY
jgi:hypothetical protein